MDTAVKPGAEVKDLVKEKRPDSSKSKDRQERQSASTAPAELETDGDQKSPFQTPRKNKTSDRWRRSTNPADEAGDEPLAREPTPIANNPFLSPVKSTRRDSTQTSVKKAKGYPTPVSDPAHRNPFEDDVVASTDQGTPRKGGTPGDAITKSPAKQAFLFAPSPKRLKSLLEVNSLHASSSRDPASIASPGKSTAVPAVTPRTRARKRLRGEEVDETPEKERERDGKSLKIGSRWAQARSSRLRRSGGAEDMAVDAVTGEGDGKDPQSAKRINVWKRNVQEETMTVEAMEMEVPASDDDDEVLGPTPVKTPAGHLPNGLASGKRLFLDMLPPLDTTPRRPASVKVQSKVDEVQHTSTQGKLPDDGGIAATEDFTRTPSKAMSRFLAGKPKSTASPHTTSIDPATASPEKMDTSEDPSPKKAFEGLPVDTYQPDDTDDEEEAIPVEAVDIEEFETGEEDSGTQPERLLSQKALAKDIVLSDDEDAEGEGALDGDDTPMDDEDHPSTSKGGRTLRIESYRYTLQQKVAQQRTKRKAGIFDENDIAEMQAYDDAESDEDPSETTPSNQPDPFQALSRLSIQSPESKIIRKTMALQQARAKAIFDARARERLRAAKRAPVYGAGEGFGGAGEDDEGAGHGRDVDPFEGEGDDDDWESDPEGWKATGLPDDDDW